jgi:hypothetical protein
MEGGLLTFPALPLFYCPTVLHCTQSQGTGLVNYRKILYFTAVNTAKLLEWPEVQTQKSVKTCILLKVLLY